MPLGGVAGPHSPDCEDISGSKSDSPLKADDNKLGF